MNRNFVITSIALLSGCATLSGCTTLSGEQATEAALATATDARFVATIVEGRGLSHDVFYRPSPGAETVWVFIEGDGSPWTDGGTQIADNPTARNPLALRLALQTPGAVLYLGRPCYSRARNDSRCTSTLWTADRYSDKVTSSMNAALRNVLKDSQRIVLIGYSGGGTLALLMAQTLPNVAAVVTIAGNLDTDAWTRRHGYTPLNGRNPADEAPLPNSIAQIYLIGDKDENVTEFMAARYLARVPPEKIWRYEKFGHVCCWEQAWPEILTKVETTLARR